jgi:hypothetical protein
LAKNYSAGLAIAGPALFICAAGYFLFWSSLSMIDYLRTAHQRPFE